LPSGKLGGYVGLVNLSINLGNFEKAKSQAKQGIELAGKLKQADWETWIRFSLSNIYFRTMELDLALEEIEKARVLAVETESLPSERMALALKGIFYVRGGLADEAQKIVDRLDELVMEGSNKNAIRLSYLVKGEIEKEKGNFPLAIELLKKAIPLLPAEDDLGVEGHPIFYESLAETYYRSGDLVKASEIFERISLLTVSRINFGDIYAKSFYMLGKINEEQGNIAKSIEHYEKFLDLWKDADPGIAEVEDAKKRLAGLKN
jgi:tetratricopeptide (TPR) repeat protein